MRKKKAENKYKKISKYKEFNRLIPSTVYFTTQKTLSKEYSIFSSLNFLNRNTDYFVATKFTVNTVLTTIFTQDEISDLISKTASVSYEDLVKKVKKALKGKSESIALTNVANRVKDFIKNVKEENVKESDAKNQVNDTNSPITSKYNNNSEGLIENVVKVYGDNRYVKYFSKLEEEKGKKFDFIGTMLPLIAKYQNEDDANSITNKAESYIKETYGYKFKVGNKHFIRDAITRTISLANYKSKMDQTVNMLYRVAQKMAGSKRVRLSQAKKIIDKKENNSFLNSNVTKSKEKRIVFKVHQNAIKDIVNTLTTIFMARFVFDSKYFAEIEKDLSEQVCLKMQNLKISENGKDDYWINELIQERLKVNCTQVLAANNITNANELLEIYNKNGTTIVHPEKVTCLDDLIFAVQYNNYKSVVNQPLTNLKEQKVTLKNKKPLLKNKEEKVKAPKPVKYLDEIRKTEAYKKYYEEYKARFLDFKLFNNNEEEKLQEIIENSNNNLNRLEKLAAKEDLSEVVKEKLPEEVAKNDATIDASNEMLNSKNDSVEEAKELKTYVAPVADIQINEEDKQPDLLDLIDKKERELQNQKVKDIMVSENQRTLFDLLGENASNIDNDNPIFIDDEIDPGLEEIEREESFDCETDKSLTFKAERTISQLTEEELTKKIKKFYSVIVNGKSNEQGVLDAMLNYRVIHVDDKEFAKKGNNSERLTDAKLSKFNKVRDFIADQFVELSTSYTLNYYKANKDNFIDLRVRDLCLSYYKEIAKMEDKNFTRKNLKQFAAVYIAQETNKQIKDFGVELYTGTNTFKKYHDAVEESTK